MRVVTLIVVSALLLSTMALAQTRWQPKEFPIGYWYGPPPEANTLETWQTVADAGFTFGGMTGYGREGNLRMLDYCQQVGIQAMVIDGRTQLGTLASDNWREVLRQVVADYGHHPALFGYYIQDEPNYRSFRDLGLISQELERLDPRHLPYINLFPTYASVEQLGNPTYADHLETFLSIVKPVILSYDHYALLSNDSERPDWFENLALIREAALRHDKPPWVIILSLPHLGYRDPTAAEMRWQVYTSLAYGMKGIMYFTYWTHPDWEKAGQIAIVDSQGRPARLYSIVKKLNTEIRTLGRVLLGLESTGVYHTRQPAASGSPAWPTAPPYRADDWSPPGTMVLGADAEVGVSGQQPVVVGTFRDARGTAYVLVANQSFRTAADVTLTVRPHVTGVRLMDPSTGAMRPQTLDGRKLSLRLDRGDGKLLRLEGRFERPEPAPPLSEISFEFDRAGQREGWEGFNSLAEPVVRGGTLTLTVTGEDPFMVRGNLGLKPNQYTAIAVRMKLPPCNPEGQLFWVTSESPGFSDDKYVNFPVQPDGEWHEYRIPVARHAQWKGKAVRGIRLDPTTGGAAPGSKIEIDWIRGE
ncbi:MAG: hypothetical protein HPY69_01720 [Armatimonadetes bacterium]|nr:hypothetical protein [Armatimonadota bacterium]